jgi:hypothetical protein
MSYIVLALGGLLALGGALALFTSYGIIMVERGWAGVIAGSTALAGGVVTLALGLILHRLSSFYALLKTGTTLPPGSAEDETGAPAMAQIPHYVPRAAILPETAPVSAAMPPASGLRSWAQRQARSAHTPGRNVFKSRGPAAQAALKIRETDPAAPQSPFSPPSPSNGNAAALDSQSESGSAATIPTATAGEAEEHTPQHPAPFEMTHAEATRNGDRDEPWPLQNNGGSKPLIVPPFPEMPIAAAEAQEQSSPRNSWPTEPALIETILPETGHMPHEPVVEASTEGTEKSLPEVQEEKNLQQLPHKDGTEARPPESETGDESPSDQAIRGDTLAIVGRYESDGTSYVMYADGSIEARTDHAVFHFKSMDELKTYMESQAKKSEE